MSTIEPAGNQADSEQPVLGYAGRAPTPASPAAVVWCRILALWMLAWGLYQGATFLASVAMVFAPGGYRFATAMMGVIDAAIVSGTWLLMGWYCWRKAPALARKMSEGTEPSANPGSMSANELLGVIVVGIGVYLLADGLPTMSWVVVTIVENVRNGPTGQTTYERTMVSGVIRCALGVWLILGTGGVVERVRGYSGRWRDESSVKSEEMDSR